VLTVFVPAVVSFLEDKPRTAAPLIDRLGGPAAVKTAVDKFYVKVSSTALEQPAADGAHFDCLLKLCCGRPAPDMWGMTSPALQASGSSVHLLLGMCANPAAQNLHSLRQDRQAAHLPSNTLVVSPAGVGC
jgi:hypothetical protein